MIQVQKLLHKAGVAKHTLIIFTRVISTIIPVLYIKVQAQAFQVTIQFIL